MPGTVSIVNIECCYCSSMDVYWVFWKSWITMSTCLRHFNLISRQVFLMTLPFSSMTIPFKKLPNNSYLFPSPSSPKWNSSLNDLFIPNMTYSMFLSCQVSNLTRKNLFRNILNIDQVASLKNSFEWIYFKTFLNLWGNA